MAPGGGGEGENVYDTADGLGKERRATEWNCPGSSDADPTYDMGGGGDPTYDMGGGGDATYDMGGGSDDLYVPRHPSAQMLTCPMLRRGVPLRLDAGLPHASACWTALTWRSGA